MTVAGSFVIPCGHPSLPGHFPGRPVVPGVVLLDFAFALILAQKGGRLDRIARVKFLAPVRPEEEVCVSYERATGSAVTFEAAVAGVAVLRGTAVLASGAAAISAVSSLP